MQTLWSTTNTYTILKSGEPVGWIRFIKWAGRRGWFIDDVSPGLPVSVTDYSAELAKDKLTAAGLTWEPGESKNRYVYS
jgi:hypothetical protein